MKPWYTFIFSTLNQLQEGNIVQNKYYFFILTTKIHIIKSKVMHIQYSVFGVRHMLYSEVSVKGGSMSKGWCTFGLKKI